MRIEPIAMIYMSFSKGCLTATALLVASLFVGAADLRAQSTDDALRFAGRAPATGARMMGMAGAGTAGIADFSALLSNPAGLAYFNKSAVSADLNTLSTRDESWFNATGFRGADESDLRSTGLANFSYIAKAPTVKGSLVFGIGYNRVNSFDRDLAFEGDNSGSSISSFFLPLASEYETFINPGPDDRQGTSDDFYDFEVFRPLSFIAYQTYAIDFYEDRAQRNEYPFLEVVDIGAGKIRQIGRVIEEGGTNEVNFGGALEASKGVMVGLSANLAFGSYQFDRTFEESDVNNANNGNNGTADFDYLVFGERFKSDLVGVNVRAGLSTEIPGGLRLGVTIETPTYFSIDETYSTTLETGFDNGQNYSYGFNPDDDEGAGEFEYQITTPWRLAGGLAYSQAGLTVSGDVEFVDWSQMRMEASESETYFANLNTEIRDNLEAVLNTRFGLEYRLGALALRGGIAFQPDPRQSDIERGDGETLDRTRNYLSAGIGFMVADQIQLDLGWMQMRTQDLYLPYTEVENAPLVDEDIIRNRVSLGVKVLF